MPTVSLRSRMVFALVAMTTLGLTVYGVATYRSFADAELDRLDEDLQGLVGLVAGELAAREQGASLTHAWQDPRHGNGHRVVVPPGIYAELRASDGSVIADLQVAGADARPDLAGIGAPGVEGIVTVDAAEGDGRWRVLSRPTRQGRVLLAAAPMTAVERSLDRLLATELTAGAGVLLVLGLGAWLLLRRELRPLERIADTAGSITAGRLDVRVPNQAPSAEVGQLATSLNSMLDELEATFRSREASEARLRRFLADASHELRTPLTSIQGFAELFRLGEQGRQVRLPVVMRRIEEEAARMRRLVEDLLLLARLDETRPPDVAEVDLAVLAADACTDAVAAAPDRSVHLDAPEPVVVVADAAHLRQALGNLLGNAVRHTPAGTPIEVRVGLDHGRPAVTVHDHGPGLDEEAIGHAFDRFWRADPARAGAGAGLGLAIVRAIAEQHDGDVEAANAPDGGAVFTIRLPAARHTRHGQEPQTAMATRPAWVGERDQPPRD